MEVGYSIPDARALRLRRIHYHGRRMTIPALDQFDLHHRLARTRGVALVMFTAAGCGACRRMRAALTDVLAARPALRVFEVDAGIDQALANEFDVFHLPALFVYRDGQYHGPLSVEPTPARIEAGLQALLARPAQEPP